MPLGREGNPGNLRGATWHARLIVRRLGDFVQQSSWTNSLSRFLLAGSRLGIGQDHLQVKKKNSMKINPIDYYEANLGYFMKRYPAKIIEYAQFSENDTLCCPVCGWEGTSKGNKEFYDDLLDVSCPQCTKMLLVVSYPLVGKSK